MVFLAFVRCQQGLYLLENWLIHRCHGGWLCLLRWLLVPKTVVDGTEVGRDRLSFHLIFQLRFEPITRLCDAQLEIFDVFGVQLIVDGRDVWLVLVYKPKA